MVPSREIFGKPASFLAFRIFKICHALKDFVGLQEDFEVASWDHLTLLEHRKLQISIFFALLDHSPLWTDCLICYGA